MGTIGVKRTSTRYMFGPESSFKCVRAIGHKPAVARAGSDQWARTLTAALAWEANILDKQLSRGG